LLTQAALGVGQVTDSARIWLFLGQFSGESDGNEVKLSPRPRKDNGWILVSRWNMLNWLWFYYWNEFPTWRHGFQRLEAARFCGFTPHFAGVCGSDERHG